MSEKITIAPVFEFAYEVENRKKFQAAGHFVPGLTDARGNRREWEGPDVHIATLALTANEGISGVAPDTVQVLRVYSDSKPDLFVRGSRELESLFRSLYFNSLRQTNTAEAYRVALERIRELVAEQEKSVKLGSKRKVKR